MTDLSSLIARLEEGSGEDRELDGHLHKLIEPSTTHPSPFESWRWGFISHAQGETPRWHPVPDLTSSLDAALAFAESQLPGWGVDISHCPLGVYRA